MKNNYYKEIEPLLLKFFKNDSEKMVRWLYTPNSLWKATPIALILIGDERPLTWIKGQLLNV